MSRIARGALAAALTLVGRSPAADIVVVQGRLAEWPGYSQTRFQADQDSLAQARYMGVGGDELRTLRLESMRQQAELYRVAQLAYAAARRDAGRSVPGEILPLYMILDEAGDWAYAQPYARFTVRGEEVQAPALILGLRRRYQPGASPRTEETSETNAAIRAAVARFWEDELGRQSFDEELSLWVFSRGEPGEFHLGEAHGRLGTGTYLSQLEAVMQHRLEGEALSGWTRLKRETLQPLAEQGNRVGLAMQILRSISHELGHLIHFASVGPDNYKGSGYLPHLQGTSHSRDTLSSPEFAFTEGFAMANSMFVLGTPKEPEPFHANKVDYAATLAVVRAKLEAAAQAGQEDHPEVAHLRRVEAYLEGLQARAATEDDRKRRYDFLRSEYAVGALLAKLRRHMGKDRSWRMTQTVATRAPATLAGLLEGHVADLQATGHLDQVADLYAAIAEFSQGILVTAAQAALFQDPEVARAHAIDLDRDGRLPGGAPAGAAFPDLFPPEPEPVEGVADPLAWTGDGSPLFASEARVGEADAPRPWHAEPSTRRPRDPGRAVCVSCGPSPDRLPDFQDLR